MDGSEVETSPEEVSKSLPMSQKGSYANVVQGKSGPKGLTKYEVEITMKDGIGSVEVPEDVFKDSSPLWEDFLIGRFMAAAPHIAKVHAIVNKIWAQSDRSQMIDVYEINSTSMKFKISNPDARARILRRGMWNLAGIPVVMAKWKPFEEDEKAEETSIPLWVHMKNVPRDMFSWKGLSFVASPTGVPDRLHPETAQCLNLKVAKIFVKTDLTKELPKSLVFNFHGKATKVEYFYPWLPSKCANCQKWGHLAKSCLVNANNNIKACEEKSDLVEKENTISTEVQQEVVEKMMEDVIVEAEREDLVLNKEIHLNGKEVSAEHRADYDGVEVTQTEGEWSEVTPGRGSCSPNKNKNLEYGRVSILSNSRFSVLSTDKEGSVEEWEKQQEDPKEEGQIPEGQKEISKEDGEIVEEIPVVQKDSDKTFVLAGDRGTGEPETRANVQDVKLQPIQHSERETITLRQSLPRDSKEKHKFLSESSVLKPKDSHPKVSNKKNSRKHH